MKRDVRRLAGPMALAFALVPTSILSQSRIPVYQLAPDTPLATDGLSIFGVATDGRALLVSAGSGSDWRVLAKHPTPSRISGLAWDRGMLYLSDEHAKAIFQIPVAQFAGKAAVQALNPEVRAQVFVQGGLLRPRGLAFADGLLVADPEAAMVLRIDPGTSKPIPFATNIPFDDIELASDRKAVAIASARAGEVRFPPAYIYKGSAPPGEFAVWRTRVPDSGPNTAPEGTAVARRRFPLIQNPSSPALAHGSLYLIDQADGSVYVSFRRQGRPIPISPFASTRRATRLLPIGDSLLVLDATRGTLDRWPLPVPAEVDLGDNPDQALDALIPFLQARGVLPTRTVPLQGSIDDTLRAEGLARGPVGPGLRGVMCDLNRALCSSSFGGPGLVRIPDVPIESALDLETLAPEELGNGTLGEKVDQRISSPEFRRFGSPNELWELNASRLVALDTTRSRQPTRERWGPYSFERIRDLRGRDFPSTFRLTVPVESVRAFVAVPRTIWRDDERLAAIRLQSPGFNWNLLEDVEAKAQGIQPTTPPAPVPCDHRSLAQDYVQLRQTIHYPVIEQPPAPVTVGVVDPSTIDVQHPTFGPNHDAIVFLPTQSAPPAATPAGQPDCGATWNKTDHATAAASLIAGRATDLEGFAPNAMVVGLSSNDDEVGQQLYSAFRQRNVRIFNLSLHYDNRLVQNIRRKINDMQDALFVVAAGNDVTDSKPVCESATPYPAYPVCDGRRKNVLVVAATGLDGTALIDRTTTEPGSNWNEELVHIAAPGTGYSAAGRDNTYKRVSGTSFAAPLVTATAALLFAEGVQSPWLIKQRIIATADQRDNLLHKVYGAGLLNVSRAITEPKHSLLINDQGTKVVQLEPGNIEISWQTKSGGSRTLPLSDVRRLTRSPGGGSYRIVYYDDVTDSIVVQDDVDPAGWPIEYRLIDTRTGAPTGAKMQDKLGNFRDYVGAIIF